MKMISFADRPWLTGTTARLLSPVRVPSVERVRDAFIRLHQENPRHPLICKIDRMAKVWRPVENNDWDRHLDRIVGRTVDGDPGAWVRQALDTADAEIPLRISVNNERIGLVASHVLGDDRTIIGILNALISTSDNTGVLLAMPSTSSTKEILRICVDYYTGQPANLRRIGSHYRRYIHRMGRPVPVATRPPIRVVGFEFDNDALSLIAAWRARHAQGTSLSAVLATMLRRALKDAGVRIDEAGFHVLVDGRRYSSNTHFGNLALPVYLEVPIDSHPRAAGDAFRNLVESAWVVPASVMVASKSALAASKDRMRYIIRSAKQAGGTGVASQDKMMTTGRSDAVVSFSFLRDVPALAAVPWLAEGDRTYIVGMTPHLTESISFLLTEIGHVVYGSVSFCDSPIMSASITEAISRIHDPIRLLDRASSTDVAKCLEISK